MQPNNEHGQGSRLARSLPLSVLLGVLCLSGCRIEVTAPPNGDVATHSGSVFCEGGSRCMIEVTDTSFDETFSAYPDPGFQFIGWKKQWRGLCGGSLAPCYLSTSGFPQHDSLMDLLETDELFLLEAQFLQADHIRPHQAGDVKEYSGTLAWSLKSGESSSAEVSVRDAYSGFIFSELDAPALRVSRTLTFQDSGETLVSTSGFMQDATGTFIDLEDEDGNPYLTTATADYGVQALPSLAVPAGTAVIDYHIMFSGHTSGPITEGTRSIERFEPVEQFSESFPYPVYKVVLNDSYEYLVTYCDNKQGSQVAVQSELWVSPAKGVVRLHEETRRYNNTGSLESEQTLSLDLVKTNY